MEYPPVKGGASMVVALTLGAATTTLVVGSGPLAASRVVAALQADSKVILLATTEDNSVLAPELVERARRRELQIVGGTVDGVLEQYQDVAVAFITDTLIGSPGRRDFASAQELRKKLKARRILVNVADYPTLCDFTLPACHRADSLQIAVTTNGKGCRLASRLRREIVSKLPNDIGDAVENVARLREYARLLPATEVPYMNEDSLPSTPNEPVPQANGDRVVSESIEDQQKRRLRWVAQISEYWPLERLAALDDAGCKEALRKSASSVRDQAEFVMGDGQSRHDLHLNPVKPPGQIYLVGSGPGHPDLLTVAARHILTQKATLVLSDKLVPTEVLALIPSTTTVKIAKKYPGNNEEAQNELLVDAVAAAQRGEVVVRLKQGDPMVYGRAGDEVLYFRQHGFESTVIPGISSAIAGPTFAGIPVTQRGVADSMILCTGVGRQGKPTQLPGYVRSRTLVLLMGVARLQSLLDTLLVDNVDPSLREGRAYPPCLPVAIIERAAMPDQRVISATLSTITAAMANVGEQRPPGMIVIGWVVLALHDTGDTRVLEDAKIVSGDLDVAAHLNSLDQQRVQRWLGARGWKVTEGFRKLT